MSLMSFWSRRCSPSICLLAICWTLPVYIALAIESPSGFELRNSDRVVFLGSAFIERMQNHGFFEAALTTAFPDKNLTFRNLGWSGDTVWGDSRGVFGSRAEGFKRLVEDTLAAKPTVLVIAYGLPRFQPHKDTDPTSFVRCHFDVTTPGLARVTLNSSDELAAWLDGKPIQVISAMAFDLARGLHTLTFDINHKKRSEPLKIELIGAASGAQVQLVGGK